MKPLAQRVGFGVIVILTFSCNAPKKELKLPEGLETTKDIILINIEERELIDIYSLIQKLDSLNPLVIGLNFYYNKSVVKSLSNKFISIEEIVPYENSDGYLLLDETLEKTEQKSVNFFYSRHLIKDESHDSFGLEIASMVCSGLESKRRMKINYYGNYDVFTVTDVPSILEHSDLVTNKIVILGYIGTISPDPVLLDEFDFEVYPTPIGVMYETVIQANIVATLLNLKK